MTNDDAILNEAEEVIKEAVERNHLSQIKEHQLMMPHLVGYANDLIAQRDTDPNGVHLFVIQESEKDMGQAANPLNMPFESSTTGDFVPWFTFPDIDEAHSSMSMPTSAILWNEVRKERSKPEKGSGIAIYMKVNARVQVLYCAGKLTITTVAGNGDPMTKTARISETDPHEFFDSLNLAKSEKALCGSLLTMCEMGRIMERNMPDTYKLLLKRTIDEVGGDDE